MNLTRLLRAVALAAVVFLLTTPVKADPIIFVASLNSSQEVSATPVNSPATGFATLTLNDNGSATISLSFSGLTSTQIGAHIHGGAVGVNGPILFPLPLGNFTNFSLGVLTQTQIDRLRAGLWYVNVHTTNFPGGEIRGQLSEIPEPATLLLLGTGLLSAVGLSRRKKKQPE